ncbi:MAG: head maturation protease, ClpP-related [Xanthobacteraceae bacterium]
MSILNGSALTLYGTVSADAMDDSASFSARQVRDALAAHGDGDMTVNLNSGGGLAFEGLAIFNALKHHPGRITVCVDAIACSAASLIAMAGDEIIMRDGAMMMIHDPRSSVAGTSSELRKAAKALDTLSAQFRAIYAKRTGRDEKEIGDLMAAETWMNSDEAISGGFASSKSPEKGTPIFAAFDYRQYRNAPATLSNIGKVTMTTVQTDKTTEKSWATNFYLSAGATGLSVAELNEIVTASDTYDSARDALVDLMAAKNNANKPRPGGISTVGGETFGNPDFLAKTIGGVLYARMSGANPEGAARDLMGCSVLDLGAKLLEARGERVSWGSRDELTTRVMMSGSHSRDDFPSLLTTSGNRVLRDAYTLAQSPLKLLAKKRNAADFRPLTSIRLSEAPQLLEKGEGGELKYGSRSEAKESFALKTAGRIFSLTREAIINDDLNAFADSSRAWGRAAASYEADTLAALFTANGGNGVNLDDNNAIYTTARKNKAAAGGAINTTTLGAARQAMREFTDIDGKTLIGVAPKHLVVGSAKETEAEQALAAVAAAQTSNVNPFASKLALHVEPRLAGNAWRMFADPADLPVIVVAYLNGTEGPMMASREGWTTLGMEFRAVLDFGAGIDDWRGTYLNVGN